ncbi:interferon-induced GTP-binding protein Mx2-like [Hyperolius riggenbachi]|uniref:interferon-induced GTP-binding protein Mx2-like n=1 Tax=Hyperolius riggenbachi TaxID=752182 RepID=UPI0035A3C49B
MAAGGWHKHQDKNLLGKNYEDKIRPHIDLIDSLRSLGVEKDLALPAIAVIGDQSSGKSSVLEALSGVSLPRGNGIVTRCPLELKLKKDMGSTEWRATISYQNVTESLDSPGKVEEAVRRAQDNVAGTGKGISSELITLEIVSPNVPDLTLIDLPGITRIALQDQPVDIAQQIKQMIKRYTERQETINLAVVPSNVDIATTEALEMARKVDPTGDRTIGILTKPDLVDRGGEKEVVQTVQNRVYVLKKGYMIVKCRGLREIQNNLSMEDALKNERAFFEEHDEFSCLLKDGLATIPNLAEKLTTELVSHIARSLPNISYQIRSKLRDAEEELNAIGRGVPDSEDEKSQFLYAKIKCFSMAITHVMNGDLDGSTEDLKLYKNFRNFFSDWEKLMKNNNKNFLDELRKEVNICEDRCRGRELQGFINYKRFEDILREQILEFKKPAVTLLHSVKDLVQRCFKNEASKCFDQFENLHSSAVDKIEGLSHLLEQEAMTSVELQFTMEKIIYCQDSMHSSALRTEGGAATPTIGLLVQQDQVQLSKDELICHLQAYLKGVTNRMSNQIPLIIQHFMLREYAHKLQDQMARLITNNKQFTYLLEETHQISEQRQRLKDQIQRLSLAVKRLTKFSEGN